MPASPKPKARSAAVPLLSDELFAMLERELAKRPVAHGWPDQTWPLSRIRSRAVQAGRREPGHRSRPAGSRISLPGEGVGGRLTFRDTDIDELLAFACRDRATAYAKAVREAAPHAAPAVARVLPSGLPPNVTSQAFQGQRTSEFRRSGTAGAVSSLSSRVRPAVSRSRWHSRAAGRPPSSIAIDRSQPASPVLERRGQPRYLLDEGRAGAAPAVAEVPAAG